MKDLKIKLEWYTSNFAGVGNFYNKFRINDCKYRNHV